MAGQGVVVQPLWRAVLQRRRTARLEPGTGPHSHTNDAGDQAGRG